MKILRLAPLFLLISSCFFDLAGLQSGNKVPDAAASAVDMHSSTVVTTYDLTTSVDLLPAQDPPVAAAGCSSGLGYPVYVGAVQLYACPGIFDAGKAASLCASGYTIATAVTPNCTFAVTQTYKTYGFFTANVLYANIGADAAAPVCQWQNQSAVDRGIGGCGNAANVLTTPAGCGSTDRTMPCSAAASSFSCPTTSRGDGDFAAGLSNTDPRSGVLCYR